MRGLGYALAVLAVFGYDTFASIDFRILEPVSLNVCLSLALLVGFGFAVAGLHRVLDRRLPPPLPTEQPAYVVVVGLGAVPMLMTILFFTSPSFCGCDPAYQIGAALAVMIIATSIHHIAHATDGTPRWLLRGATVGGPVSLVAVLFFGLSRTVSNIQALL